MANAARTSQGTGRRSASARETASNPGASTSRGRQTTAGQQTQSDVSQSAGAADMSRGQQTSQGAGMGTGRSQSQSQGGSQDQARGQTQRQGQGQASGQTGAQRGDTERQVPLGRETGRQAGVSMRDQGQAIGAAGAGQRFASPFSFMRRFGEEMDRLFEDFGFAPLGLDPMDLLIPGSRAGVAPGRALGSGATAQGGQTRSGGALTRQSPSAGAVTSSRATWLPQVEVLQRGANLVVRADLPGLRPDDVRVEVDNGALTISGERSYEAEEEDEGIYHSERAYGAFLRTVPLPQGVNPDDVQARFNDGVLEVTIPLPKESRSRRIDVRGRQ